jgi:ubiquinone/menaquinone biosynthesis C-methylase UbiE
MSQQSTLTPDEVGQFYDRIATLGPPTHYNLHLGYWDNPDKDDIDGEVPFGEASDRLTDMMIEKLKIGAGSQVLDVGCGVGGPGVRIARLTGARVTGISVSQEQITRANTLAKSAELTERVVFQQANAMEIPFPAQSFDAAIALESIIHMPDRGRVLTQICRTLRPGGRLVLTDFFERAPIPAVKRPAVDRFLNDFMSTMVQAEDYPPLFRQAGLRFEEILDISEQTLHKSFTWLSTQTDRTQQNIKTKVADEIAGRFETMIDISEFGYLMVAARRPKK